MPAPVDLSADALLSTTRAVRRKLDLSRPVPRELVAECVALAVQAPAASNVQRCHFLVVEDPGRLAALAEIYRRAYKIYKNGPLAADLVVTGDPVGDAAQQRVQASADHLAAHLHEVPTLVVPCVQGWTDPGGQRATEATVLGSAIPAAWSFCLAARSRGLGTAWTTLHLVFEQEAADVLGVSYETVRQIALFPLAYALTDQFKPAWRAPVQSFVTYL